ncbi:ADP-ribose pyrophosphatase YjhB (NUDIX family) [Amycolatopsis sulphurea]|uniref:ADP-ribose pyrophosphatase YjhB (NUDIX family) n=1 Tax=Amycolatopsis sulphurea TaxID=76022 RepID=A0A2A9F7I4_9PSEU|nr:NUDIX domain-containing protein [Amycolatopsis sulphurea]PFG47304.1 ADP-ribose pyrophosphatase YjhB (NUDIX family) [Amycolatopsis sulphurea]
MTPLERCVGGIAYDDLGRLLLIRRGHAPGKGLWSLPGGRVEPGETDIEAVIRELREETGLHVTPHTPIGTVVRGHYEITDYECAVSPGPLTAGDDADDARWTDSAELVALHEAGLLTDQLFVTLRDWGALPRT